MKVAVCFAVILVVFAIFSIDHADARKFKFKRPGKRPSVSNVVTSAANAMTKVKNAGNQAKKVLSGTEALLKKMRLGGSTTGLDLLSATLTVTFSRWNQTVDGVLMPQMAFTFDDVAQSGLKAVVVRTKPSKATQSTELKPASVVYDFSQDDNTAVTVVRTGGRCYQIPATAGLTFDSASTQLKTSNGTNVTSALTDVKLNATDSKLDATAAEALMADNPQVKATCAVLPIYEATTADLATFPAAGAEGQDEMVTSVVTLTSKVTILTNKDTGMKKKVNQMKKWMRRG